MTVEYPCDNGEKARQLSWPSSLAPHPSIAWANKAADEQTQEMSMSDQTWQRTWELFHLALDKPQAERHAFLVDACAGDRELLEAVEGLLAEHTESFTLLDRPPSDFGPPADLIGQSIGAFDIEAQIGEGGMGVVYRARQTEPLQRTVALKLIQLGMNTREVMARFELERQALAMLDHPNIARIFDAGATDEGRPFFVMELVDGLPLTQYCDQHRLSTAERLELFVPICRALHHAHQKGVIHRDLKPSNVLVAVHDGKPIPKIIDFGVAKAVDPQGTTRTLFTRQGRLVGTPEYMSPEQAEHSTDIDIRTDVYALGVLLYELLTGCLPFETAELRAAAFERMVEILRSREPRTPSLRISNLGAEAQTVAERRRTDPSSLRRELRGDLDWIVMRAMEKQRSRRYGAASELAQEVERHLNDEPVLAGPPSTAYRTWKFVRRHRFGVAVTVALLLMASTFTASTIRQSTRIQRALEQAQKEAQKAEQVSDFLTRLFRVSNPTEAKGNSILAREILDRGADQIRDELGDQPEVRADMMQVIGWVYAHLGLFNEAEPLLTRSLETRRSLFGEDAQEVVDVMHYLAMVHFWKGDFEAAEKVMRDSLVIDRKLHGPQGSDVSVTLHRLGEVLLKAGKLPQAEQALRDALAIRIEISGAEHREAGSQLFTLAFIRMELGDFQEAESLVRRSLAIANKTLEEDNPDRGRRLEMLAFVLHKLGRYDEAAPVSQRVLELTRRSYGDDHPRTAAALTNAALRLGRMGETDTAEAHYLEAIAILRRQDPIPPELSGTLSNFGAFYRRQGRLHEAIDLQREAVEIGRAALGTHPAVANALNNLGVALLETNALDEVELVCREVLAMRTELFNESHPGLANPLECLGIVSRRRGNLNNAESFYRQAVDLQKQSGTAPVQSVGTRYNLALVLRDLGRLDEAELMLRETLEIERRAKGKDHTDTAQQMAALGSVLTAAGKLDEAEKILRNALKIQRRDLPENEDQRLLAELFLGANLIESRQLDEAEPLLLGAWKGLTEIQGPRDIETLKAVAALERLYTAWDRKAEARRFRELMPSHRPGTGH